MFLSQIHPCLHMLDDGAGRQRWRHRVMGVRATRLVLHEEVRAVHLPDVVVESADADEQRFVLPPDVLRCIARDAGDDERAVVGAWRLCQERLQEGVAGIGQLQEAHIRHRLQGVLQHSGRQVAAEDPRESRQERPPSPGRQVSRRERLAAQTRTPLQVEVHEPDGHEGEHRAGEADQRHLGEPIGEVPLSQHPRDPAR